MRWLPLLVLAACSDSPSSSVDAPGATADAYDAARCLIKGDFGAVGSVTGMPTMGANTLSATLDAGPPRDTFFLKLTAGRGVFAAGVAPGTYPISGVDAGYLTCGLCVHVIADIVTGTGPSKFYFADSGTVTLTSTAPIVGSAMNLHLTAVDINSGQKIADGCDATIASINFMNQ
ncbi:MAG TPA: hypothetical protein VIV11_17090 [Kofleriaceae bacterium]